MTEDYTPSIHIEPPHDSDEHLLTSLGMFDNYCPSPPERDSTLASADCRYPPALFIQPEVPSISTELSHLDVFLPTDRKYSPSNSGRSSPIEGWSPVSSYSGDIFPEDLNSEEFVNWPQQHQHSFSAHSSPVSPALSLTSAFDTFALDESYPSDDHTVLPNGPPAFSRLRSSSHSVHGVSPAEVWGDGGVGRGRSSSVSATMTTQTQFYPNESSGQYNSYADPTKVQISVADADVSLSQSLGTGMHWGHGNGNTANNGAPALGALVTGWKYPNNESPSADRPPPSPSLLTVPGTGVSLQRRGASRRSRSHSDLNSMVPSDADVGRGRGQHRTTLSIPNSRSVSNGSRASSRDASPHSPYHDLHRLPPLPSSSPSSPAFEDAESEHDRDGAVPISRRRTFTAIRGPDELLTTTTPSLSRTLSAPLKGRRSHASMGASATSLGVFKAEQTDTSAFVSLHSSGGLQQEFRLTSALPSVSFKAEVASKKIRQASSARRINIAPFKCPIATCSSTFTARHNLMNHINSHNKHRPYKCLCGLTFTTQGVLNRHKKNKKCQHHQKLEQ